MLTRRNVINRLSSSLQKMDHLITVKQTKFAVQKGESLINKQTKRED